jgi:hypothetical protein
MIFSNVIQAGWRTIPSFMLIASMGVFSVSFQVRISRFPRPRAYSMVRSFQPGIDAWRYRNQSPGCTARYPCIVSDTRSDRLRVIDDIRGREELVWFHHGAASIDC